MKPFTVSFGFLSLALIAACGAAEKSEDYFHWDVSAVGVADDCNVPAETFSDELIYALAFTGSATDLAIFEEGDYNSFAAGLLGGCRLTYESSVVKESRGDSDEAYIQWQLSGEAFMQFGGQGCDIEARVNELLLSLPGEGANGRDWESLAIDSKPKDLDWIGTETFEIVGVGNDIQGLEPGCTYQLLTAGVNSGKGS
jgi:hypothetical protein